MDQLTDLIQAEIKNRYRSLRQFSMSVGIPHTTLVSALKNGVGGTAYRTIVKICKELDIQLVGHEYITNLDEDAVRMFSYYSTLDDAGKRAVNNIIGDEYRRCQRKNMTNN